ncbi:MAG: MFS transporter [Pseudomonadales bacterium]|jgi:MFS family permease
MSENTIDSRSESRSDSNSEAGNIINPESNNDTGGNEEIGGRYSKYVLGVLVIVYIFNFIDRQILSILAEDIKADLGITDAEIGFLYGTAFAVFYAVFGIPLGRLADTWVRKSLISIGLMFWSVMTALSGTARSFGMLAGYRIGVGIGEASATPAAFSMLSDYFPPKLRTTALAVYSSGVYIGGGIGIFLGGVILDSWSTLYPDTSLAPMQLKGWHVAFFIVGLPGLLMALWVWTLKEPMRGQSEGIITPPHPHPFREAWMELSAILPIVHFYRLVSLGSGAKGVIINMIMGMSIAALAYFLYLQTGTAAQWVALGIGVYAACCWAQSLALRDYATYSMIFRCKSIMFSAIAFPCMAFVTYGLGFWGPPFFQRVHGVSASEAGMILGMSSAIGGWAGVTIGGIVADKLRERNVRAKLYVGVASVVLSVPSAIGFILSDDVTTAYVFNFLFSLTSPLWVGPAAATINDLVMPRMRAIASAFYIMMVTFIGLALGPYTMGQISDALNNSGQSSADALTTGMLWGVSAYVMALIMLMLAIANIAKDQGSRLDRARALGENVD